MSIPQERSFIMKKEIRNNFAGLFMLAAATALSTVPVFMPLTAAADTIITNTPTQGTLTVTKKDTSSAHNPIAGAKYTAYKIMSLTPGKNAGDYASYEITETYKKVLGDIHADTLGNYSAVYIERLVKELEAVSREDTAGIECTAPTAENGSTVFTLPTGWYLIVETKTPTGAIAGMPFLVSIPSTKHILAPDSTEIIGAEWNYAIEAAPKSPMVSVDKNIINAKAAKDSTFVKENKSYIGRHDTAALGDLVEYEITATVPEFADTFFHNNAVPKFEFTDTLSKGLTLLNEENHLVKVYVGDNEIPASEDDKLYYELSAEPQEDNRIADLKLVFKKDFLTNDLYRGQTVSIRYCAQVNADAVMGNAGNTNNVVLTYNDRPGSEVSASPVPDGDEPVPDSYVYTYGITIDKFSEEGSAPLAGAQFMLFTDAGLTNPVKGGDGKEVQITDATGTTGSISFPRIDAGTYYLKEVASPANYSLLANPVKIKIIPSVDGEQKILKGDFTLEVNDVAVAATTGEHVTKLSTESGLVTVAIENHKGFSLPITGGSGIFFTIALSAAGLLVITFYMLKSQKKEE